MHKGQTALATLDISLFLITLVGQFKTKAQCFQHAVRDLVKKSAIILLVGKYTHQFISVISVSSSISAKLGF